MARIVFGVQGDARGHVSQALAVAASLPEHVFLFVGGRHVRSLREHGYRVMEVPPLTTAYRNNRVAPIRTAIEGGWRLATRGAVVARLVRAFDGFAPDLALTSYELYVPEAARRIGVPCVSIDNQHAISLCRPDLLIPPRRDRALFAAPLELIFSRADHYLVNSFAPLTPRDPATTRVFPPLIAPEARAVRPSRGSGVVVYQTSPSFTPLLRALARCGFESRVFGCGERPSHGRVRFERPSRPLFLEALAACRAFIGNGGHTAISEALHLGKPVLSFPIRGAYEQWLNGYMVAALGYGAYSMSRRPTPRDLEAFYEDSPRYEARIASRSFCGNDEVAAAINAMLARPRARAATGNA